MLTFHGSLSVVRLVAFGTIANALAGCFAYGMDPAPDTPELVGMDPPSSPSNDTGVCEVGQVTRCNTRCAEGNAPSCNNLGAMYELGAGVTRDLGHATRLYDRACAAGAAAGCINAQRLRGPTNRVTIVTTPAPAPAPAVDDDDDLYSGLDR